MWNKNNINGNLNLGKYEGVDRVLVWMRSQDDDLLALASHSLAWAVGREDSKAALDYFVEHVPPETPCRQRDADAFAADWALLAVQGVGPPEEQRRYLQRILEPIVESGDATRLSNWLPISQRTGVWWDLLEKHMSPEQSSAWLTKTIERLSRDETSPAPNTVVVPDARYAMLKHLGDALARIKGTPTPACATDPLWKLYRVVRLPADIPEDTPNLAAMSHVEDRLLFVWLGEKSPDAKKASRLKLTALNLADGVSTPLGTTVLERDTQVSSVAVDRDAVYVGMSDGGLAAVRDGNVQVWNESNGLPANCVRAVAVFRHNLYFSIATKRGSGLYRLENGAGKFTTLLSSRADSTDPGLNDGKPFCITSILGDEKRNCLWLGLGDLIGAFFSRGLWKYDLSTGRAVKLLGDGCTVDGLRWHEDSLAFWSAPYQGVETIDPASGGRDRTFLGHGLSTFGRSERDVHIWPYLHFGDHIITWNTRVHASINSVHHIFPAGLTLHLKGRPVSAPLRNDVDWDKADVEMICQLNDREGVIGNRRGQVWRITRTDSAPGEMNGTVAR